MERGVSSVFPADEHSSDRGRRAGVHRLSRQRLLNYVMDIIKKQTTPLQDVIRDHVLQYLPAQSLLRLRSVSASWNYHISAPFFAHSQSYAHRTLSGFFYQVSYQVSYLPFDSTAHAVPDPSLSFIGDAVRVVSSSNGLVVCRSLTFGGTGLLYYICNPVTMQWTTLPPMFSDFHQHAAVLVFQPSALDFSPIYHLVCLLSLPGSVKVFSSQTGEWRISHAAARTKAAAEAWASIARSPAVAVGGITYWRTTKDSVVSYNPGTDVLHVLPAPAGGRHKWQLGEMDGRLCCVGAAEGKVEVHALQSCDASWHTIGCFDVPGDPVPMAFEGREKRVVVWVEGRVVAINVRSGCATMLGTGMPECAALEGVPYISSLASVPEACAGPMSFTCSSHQGHPSIDQRGSADLHF